MLAMGLCRSLPVRGGGSRRPDRAVRSGPEAFVGPGPRWVEGLFALRNRIVSVFGFKTPAARGKNAAGHGGEWESGERVGIFEVLARSTDEIVLGDNDRHLDLRVSLLVERGGRDGREKMLSVTTAVRLNDRLGRCYFCFIKPFHRMIVPAVVKRSLHRLESEVRAGSADG